MPKLVPQSLKALTTIKMQPQKVDSRMEVIMCLDIAGKSGRDIADHLKIGEQRISIIRNSPLYLNRIVEKREEMKTLFMEKQTDQMTSGDPIEEALKNAALDAAKKKIDLMENSGSEFVQAAAAGDILDRAGYKSYTEKTKVTVEVTEKMANRFERALNYEHPDNDRKTKVSITQEMS